MYWAAGLQAFEKGESAEVVRLNDDNDLQEALSDLQMFSQPLSIFDSNNDQSSCQYLKITTRP